MKCLSMLVVAALSPACFAICIGDVTTDFKCVVPIIDDAGNTVGSGILVGKNKIITADHVPGSRTKLGLTTHKASQRVSAPKRPDGTQPDLAVLIFDSEISTDYYTIDTGAVPIGSTICIIGYGNSSTDTTSPFTLKQDTDNTRRVAKNTVDTATSLSTDDDPKKYKDDVYCYDFDRPGNTPPNDGITTPGDSGGATFVVDPSGKSRLVGMIVGGEASDTTAKYGDQSYSSKLSNYKDWISSVPEPSSTATMALGLIAIAARRRRKSYSPIAESP